MISRAGGPWTPRSWPPPTRRCATGPHPTLPPARPLAQRYLVGIAALLGRQPDAAMRRELLARYAEHDPRSERWWELVAVLQGLPGWSSSAGAYRWLGAACQAHLAAV